MTNKTITDKTKNANSIIKNHMIWSMGAGAIPVPIADFFAVSAIHLDMIRQLSKLYDVDFKQTEGKAIITALSGSGIARLGASAIKTIPGIGSVLGGFTFAIIAAATTYALGEVFKKHFETGGTFLDFDPGRLKKYYNEKFEKGKKIAQELKEKHEEKEKVYTSHKQNQTDPLEKLKELGQLKNDGVITEEEFEKMKKKIIDQ